MTAKEYLWRVRDAERELKQLEQAYTQARADILHLKGIAYDADKVTGGEDRRSLRCNGLTDEEKLAYMQIIFGTEAATGWLNVLEAGPEVFNDLVAQMENCDGEAEKMAEVMLNNAKGSIVQLQSAVEGAAISIGTIFLPAVADAAKWGADAAATVSTWVKEHEGLTKGAVEAGAAIAALVVAVKGFQLASAVYSYAARHLCGSIGS